MAKFTPVMVAPTYTVADVAQALQISRNLVLELLNSGELQGVRVGKRWRVTPAQLEAYLGAEATA